MLETKHCLNLTTAEAQKLAAKDPELRLLLEAAIPEAFADGPLRIIVSERYGFSHDTAPYARPLFAPVHPEHNAKSLYLDTRFTWCIEDLNKGAQGAECFILVARRKQQ